MLVYIVLGVWFAVLLLTWSLARAADDGRLPHPPEKPTDLMAERDRDAAFDRDFLLISEGKPPVDDWDWPMVEREIA